MKQRNIGKESEKAIKDGIIDLALGKHEEAEQKFKVIVNDLEGRMNSATGYRLFKYQLQIAAFGQGLAEGIKEYEGYDRPRPISEVAVASKNLYNSFMALCRESNIDYEGYEHLGKNYALSGLENEGLMVLERSLDSDIISTFRIYKDRVKLLKDEKG
ncbi:MAG TPA: hypothetical protein ENH85_10395 [Candidatus Scalindua sp.]|nr:hypothetical protein [Candidatus Scalindua sp.]